MKAGQMGQVGRVGLVGFVGAAVVVVAATASVLKDGARSFQASVAAQAPNPNAPKNFVKIQAPVVALTHARVIDGTGAPARADQTIVI